MSKVRIVQVLCPSRHCIIATAYQSPDGEEIPEMKARLREKAETMIARGEMNPWCGICRSRKWTYEDAPTVFATMEEAAPYLAQNAADQAATREYFRASRG